MAETTSTDNREIVSTRVFDYPRELVWQAWTDPKHLSQWWGPHGFQNTFHIFDLKPGGVWEFVMHGPDATDYPNKSIFVEIVKPKRLVFDHVSGHIFRVTVTFDMQDDKTKVIFRMRFESIAEYEKVKHIVIEKNEENFDRLETELSKMR